MRLIDADILQEELKGKNITFSCEFTSCADLPNIVQNVIEKYKKMVIDTINNQHNAYDVDKVVEQLESYSDADEVETGIIPVIELDQAIKIVKSGGITE